MRDREYVREGEREKCKRDWSWSLVFTGETRSQGLKSRSGVLLKKNFFSGAVERSSLCLGFFTLVVSHLVGFRQRQVEQQQQQQLRQTLIPIPKQNFHFFCEEVSFF